MSFISIILIPVAALNLFLGFLILLKNIKDQVNKIYFIMTLCLITWALTILMSWSEIGVKHLDFWSNATFWGPSLLAGFLVYFSYIFPADQKVHYKFLIAVLIPAIFLIILALLKLINVKTYNPWTIERGFGIHLFNIYFLSCIILTFRRLYITYKKSSGVIKTQVRLFFLDSMLVQKKQWLY